MALLRSKKDKYLGQTQKTRAYDIPLDKSKGLNFVITLIGLMSFIAFLMLAGSHTLKTVGEHWAGGLENKITVEIPMVSSEDEATNTQKERIVDDVSKALQANNHVDNFEVMPQEVVNALLSPWLGDDVAFDHIPVPTLISVSLTASTPAILKSLETSLSAINDSITIDTHESWLNSVLSITRTLSAIATLILIIIIATVIISVGGAINAAMDVHKDDVELLHLMGASDQYITNQFQKHAFTLALKGSVWGTALAIIFVLILSLFSFGSYSEILPDISLDISALILIALIPAIMCFIATIAARMTVSKSLTGMP